MLNRIQGGVSRETIFLYADLRRASILPVHGPAMEPPVFGGRSGMRPQGEFYPLTTVWSKLFQ